MAFQSRLRRALTLSAPLGRYALRRPKPVSSTVACLLSIPTLTPTPASAAVQHPRLFTSTSALFRKAFDPDNDEIGPDTILFEGCDYNHWLITVDFPKDSNLTREQMIDTYVNIAAQVFGSVEEAKKKIYALSTTTYQGFQVECSEETSEKFKNIKGVVFVLPDSYIDPANKEYGGDKYVNGEIFPRPPPVHFGRLNRDRRRGEQMPYQRGNAGYDNQWSSPQRNYGPPSQQNYGPPPSRQNYEPPPPRQNYGPLSPQQNYGQPQPQQNYGPPPPQQNYVQSQPQQNYGPPRPQQNYGPPPPQQNYGPPPPQQNYGQPPQQNFRPHPQQNSAPQPPFGGERSSVPSHQGNFNVDEAGNNYRQGNRDYHHVNHENTSMVNDQRGFPQDANQGSSQAPGGERSFPAYNQ